MYRLEIENELAKLGSALWENLRSFMRWDTFSKDYKALLDACVVSGAAAGVIYFLFMLGLYAINLRCFSNGLSDITAGLST